MAEPIKNIDDINRLKKQILNDYSYKQYFFFILGINTGLTSAKSLALKWDDIKQHKGSKYLISTTPAGKKKKIYLNTSCVIELKKLRNLYPNDVWIFQSETKNKEGNYVAWSCNYPHVFLKRTAIKIKLNVSVGSFTLRKTFGYHALKSGNWDIEELSVYLSHYNPKRTREYICWDESPKKIKTFRPRIK